MTVAVAVRAADGSIVVAADSEAERGYVRQRAAPKIHTVGSMVVTGEGNVSSIRRFAEMLDSQWPLDPNIIIPSTAGTVEATARQWFASLKSDGIGTDGEHGWNTACGVVCAEDGRIWYVDGFGAATVISEPYIAVGSGAEVAMGALYAEFHRAGQGWGHPAASGPFPSTVADVAAAAWVAKVAVMAAMAHARGCGGQIQVVEVKG